MLYLCERIAVSRMTEAATIISRDAFIDVIKSKIEWHHNTLPAMSTRTVDQEPVYDLLEVYSVIHVLINRSQFLKMDRSHFTGTLIAVSKLSYH